MHWQRLSVQKPSDAFKRMGTLGRQLLQRIQYNDSFGLAAEMSFHLLLSLFPALIFISSLWGMIDKSYELYHAISPTLASMIPQDILKLFHAVSQDIQTGASGPLAFVSLFLLLWGASNGIAIILKALDRSYGETHELQIPFWVRRAMGMGAILGVGLLFFAMALMVIISSTLTETLQTQIPYLNNNIEWIGLIRQGSMVFGIAFSSFVLYFLIPRFHGTRSKFIETLPGSILFTLMWLAVSWGIGIYIHYIANLNQVYGTLTSFVVLMLWLYFSSFTLLVGMEMNGLILKMRQNA